MITCPQCGKQNRAEAKFCQYCGSSFSPQRSLLPAVPDGSPEPPQAAVTRVLPRDGEAPSVPQVERLAPLAVGSVLFHPGDPRKRYSMLMARELERSIYYDALDLTCPNCHAVYEQPPPQGTCAQCQATLTTVLIHELRASGNQHSAEQIARLLHLSAGHPGILPQRDLIQYRERTYTVAEHPGRWGVLVRGRQQRSLDEALAGAAQVGQALIHLHDHGFVHCEVGGASMESLVVVGGGRDIKLADLSACVPFPAEPAGAGQAWLQRDIAFLGNLLFYLAVGKELHRSDIQLAPPELRVLIERAVQGQYPAVRALLDDFLLPVATATLRPLRPSSGQATHPGKKHPRNEDSIVTFIFNKEQDGGTVPVGFFLVADGMGGHDAGDVASRTVNQIVADWMIKTKVLPDLRKATRKLTTEHMPSELLNQAIQQANQALLQCGQAKGSNLGSTVTAALVIGNVATIANVGDSRTYLLRDGRLEQISQDHSLVARLVDAQVIRPEDVRSHPQRNQIYRSLGHQPEADVDTFTVELRAGDRLLLCSDGLWEMVLDADIQRIVERARSPQKACDQLVETANQNGGEDNIAVIVVEME